MIQKIELLSRDRGCRGCGHSMFVDVLLLEQLLSKQISQLCPPSVYLIAAERVTAPETLLLLMLR